VGGGTLPPALFSAPLHLETMDQWINFYNFVNTMFELFYNRPFLCRILYKTYIRMPKNHFTQRPRRKGLGVVSQGDAFTQHRELLWKRMMGGGGGGAGEFFGPRGPPPPGLPPPPPIIQSVAQRYTSELDWLFFVLLFGDKKFHFLPDRYMGVFHFLFGDHVLLL